MDTSTRNVALALAFLLFLGAGIWWWFGGATTIEVENNGMTDTSLPPTADEERPTGVPEDWNRTETNLVSFYAPSESGSDYVEFTDWPPALNVDNEPFSCVEAGQETERAGTTEAIEVEGREYCRTTVAEGAAGSTYRQYAYAFARNDQTAILTFSVRYPQCGNYDESESAVCEAEQAEFDPDELLNGLVETLVWD